MALRLSGWKGQKHMKSAVLSFTMLMSFSLPAVQSIGKIVKESFQVKGEKRIYYLLVPKHLPQSGQVPLLITLHGSGRNGLSLVEKWQELARKENFIVAGPDAKDLSVWNMPEDGPDLLYELAEFLKSKYPVDPRRVYLFGHSAGAVFAVKIALLESQYFAAAAIHAGAFRDAREYDIIPIAERKIPMSIFVGDRDQFFPVAAVRATRKALLEAGFPVELTEMPNHDHWYYDLAPKINANAWNFLKTKQLAGDPRYIERKFR